MNNLYLYKELVLILRKNSLKLHISNNFLRLSSQGATLSTITLYKYSPRKTSVVRNLQY